MKQMTRAISFCWHWQKRYHTYYGNLPSITKCVILWISDVVDSIRLDHVGVPSYAIQGKKAVLECPYDLEGSSLYSVKWYKNGREFFRYSLFIFHKKNKEYSLELNVELFTAAHWSFNSTFVSLIYHKNYPKRSKNGPINGSKWIYETKMGKKEHCARLSLNNIW